MAKLNKLITYAYFREEVDIPQNIPDEEIEHKIYRAQEMLRMIMGNEKYFEFLEKYKKDSFDELDKQLYRYIQQFVAWQAHEFWIVKANFKPSRSGIRVHTEDNSTAATDYQMAMLIKDAKQQSEYYKKLLIDFLNKNCGCGVSNYTSNSFHISAVKNKSHHCGKRGCK